MFPGDEAIVTRFGKVFGEPRKPGVYNKIPLVDRINTINVKKLRKWEEEFVAENCSKLQILWNVSDSKAFFLASRNDNIENKLQDEFANILLFLKNDFNRIMLENNIVSTCKNNIIEINPYVAKEVRDVELERNGIKIVKLRLLE